MEKLSIIVPVYNAGKYIRKCLDSILDQDYRNAVEIITVNDGSTDDSEDILLEYQKRYPDIIRVVTKENGGAASARNVGLDMALGDWVWFCDSDDYVEKNGLSYVINNFIDDGIDICTFFTATLDEIALKSKKDFSNIYGSVIYEGNTIHRYEQEFATFAVNNIYRLDAIRGIRFRDMPIAEDMMFNLEVYMKDLRIRCTSASIYRYTVNNAQMTRKRDVNTMRQSIQGYENMFVIAKNIQNNSSNTSVSRSIDKFIAYQFTPYMSRVLSANLCKREYSEIINRLKRNCIFPIKEYKKSHAILNLMGRMTWLYPLESLLYRKLFVPYILPKLSRN